MGLAMTDNIFGENRDDEPGITPLPGQLPPQLTDFMVESAAMHSKSRGWLPAVVFRVATEDGAGLVFTMEVGPQLMEILNNIGTAGTRAYEDVLAGREDGTLL